MEDKANGNSKKRRIKYGIYLILFIGILFFVFTYLRNKDKETEDSFIMMQDPDYFYFKKADNSVWEYCQDYDIGKLLTKNEEASENFYIWQKETSKIAGDEHYMRTEENVLFYANNAYMFEKEDGTKVNWWEWELLKQDRNNKEDELIAEKVVSNRVDVYGNLFYLQMNEEMEKDLYYYHADSKRYTFIAGDVYNFQLSENKNMLLWYDKEKSIYCAPITKKGIGEVGENVGSFDDYLYLSENGGSIFYNKDSTFYCYLTLENKLCEIADDISPITITRTEEGSVFWYEKKLYPMIQNQSDTVIVDIPIESDIEKKLWRYMERLPTYSSTTLNYSQLYCYKEETQESYLMEEGIFSQFIYKKYGENIIAYYMWDEQVLEEMKWWFSDSIKGFMEKYEDVPEERYAHYGEPRKWAWKSADRWSEQVRRGENAILYVLIDGEKYQLDIPITKYHGFKMEISEEDKKISFIGELIDGKSNACYDIFEVDYSNEVDIKIQKIVEDAKKKWFLENEWYYWKYEEVDNEEVKKLYCASGDEVLTTQREANTWRLQKAINRDLFIFQKSDDTYLYNTPYPLMLTDGEQTIKLADKVVVYFFYGSGNVAMLRLNGDLVVYEDRELKLIARNVTDMVTMPEESSVYKEVPSDLVPLVALEEENEVEEDEEVIDLEEDISWEYQDYYMKMNKEVLAPCVNDFEYSTSSYAPFIMKHSSDKVGLYMVALKDAEEISDILLRAKELRSSYSREGFKMGYVDYFIVEEGIYQYDWFFMYNRGMDISVVEVIGEELPYVYIFMNEFDHEYKGETVQDIIPEILAATIFNPYDYAYVVQEGDTLTEIAENILGNSGLAEQIALDNDIEDPDFIVPNQELWISEILLKEECSVPR